jgi:hypothetical protein
MFILFRKLSKLQKHTHVFFVYLVYSDQIEWYANNITRLIQMCKVLVKNNVYTDMNILNIKM